MQNSKLKTIVPILGAVFLVLAGWFVKTRYLDRPTLITVVGEGRVKVVPTMVRFSLTVNNSAPTATLAFVDNVRITKDLISSAKTAGAREEEITASYTRVIPPAQTLGQTDYQAVNTIEITLRDLVGFDNLVNQLYAVGASSVSNIVFTTENSKDLEKQAVTEAVKEAQTRARETARTLGKRVGRMVSVSTVEIGEAGAMSGEVQTQPRLTGEIISSPSQIEIVRQASIIFELR